METADGIIKKEVSIPDKYVCKLTNNLIAEPVPIYKNRTPFYMAVLNQNINAARSLIGAGINTKVTDLESKSTVLHVAVNNTDAEMLIALFFSMNLSVMEIKYVKKRIYRANYNRKSCYTKNSRRNFKPNIL